MKILKILLCHIIFIQFILIGISVYLIVIGQGSWLAYFNIIINLVYASIFIAAITSQDKTD